MRNTENSIKEIQTFKQSNMSAIRVLEKKETEIEVGAIFEANVQEFSKSNSSF